MKQLLALWKIIKGDARSTEILIQETKAERIEFERLLATRRRLFRSR